METAVYGSDMTFTTGTISPGATTGAATDITTTSATLNGNLDELGHGHQCQRVL